MRYLNNITITLPLLVLIGSLAQPAYGQLPGWQTEEISFGNKKGKINYYVSYDPYNGEETILYQEGEAIRTDRQVLDYHQKEHGFLKVLINKIENKQEKYYFFIKTECIKYTEHFYLVPQNSDLPIQTKENTLNANLELFFQAQKEGKGKITIGYGTIQNNPEEAICEAGEIIIKYDIQNLHKKITPSEDTRPPPPPPKPAEIDYEGEAWSRINQEDIVAICSFLNEYPHGKYQTSAKDAFKEQDEKLWRNIKRSKNKIDFEGYQRKVKDCLAYARHYTESIRKIKELGKKESQETEWESLDPDANEGEIAAFINTARFQANKGKAYLLLKEKYPRLEFISQKNGNAIQATILNPFFKLRYKDVSLNGGLEIDESLWQDDHILNIEIQKNENYKILVQDSIGREAIIPFGNTFEAKMEYRDSVYVINMLGEERPFHVELINNETRHSHTFIAPKDHIVLKKATLLNNGFSGEYAVKVGYGNNRRTKELQEVIYLEKERSFKTWIAGILIAVIIAIGFFLFLSLRVKEPEQTTIFHK